MSRIGILYFGYFFVVQKFFREWTLPWLHRERALGLITLQECFYFVALSEAIARLNGYENLLIEQPEVYGVLLFVGLTIVNYVLLWNDLRQAAFEEYFYSSSRRTRAIWKLIAALVTLLSFTLIVILVIAIRKTYVA